VKSARFHPDPMAAAVAVAFDREVKPILGIILEPGERHLSAEVSQALAGAVRQNHVGVATYEQALAAAYRLYEEDPEKYPLYRITPAKDTAPSEPA